LRPFWVADSSIWFDLEAGGILGVALQLEAQWACPDVLLPELREHPEGRALEGLGVEVCELPGTDVAQVFELAASNPRPSRVDLFALVLARSRQGILLTGDSDLRRLAESLGVEVHGIFWILDQLAGSRITNAEAASALDQIVARGSRLPANEVRERLARWRSE
jgi:hypothetical protein